MKIIVYAIGKIFENHKNKINWNDVVALADKHPVSAHYINGRPVITCEEINRLQYDYIIVFSNRYYGEIKAELSGYFFIPEDKIIPYGAITEKNMPPVTEFMDFCFCFLRENGCKKVLDYGMQILPDYYLTKEEVFPDMLISLSGVSENEADNNVNLYQYIYSNIADCGNDYDAILLWTNYKYTESELKDICKKGRYILFYTNYFFEEKPVKELISHKLGKYETAACISVGNGLLWAIDTKPQVREKQISVYVITHKQYNCHADEIYKPLCVGNHIQQDYLTEQSGCNIAHLNDRINECSALYWIWKNAKDHYIGMNHYRRFFYNNNLKSTDNHLNARNIYRILKTYDIILPQACRTSPLNIYEQLKNTINPELFQHGYTIIREKISKKQPDYLKSFDSVMKGYTLYACNLFVTRYEILNDYCEWLFSFLIETAEEINLDGYDNYSKRVTGFFAERMWTVWLRKNRYRIKELPYGY